MIEYHRIQKIFEIKRADINRVGEFTAYAAVFGNVDSYNNIILNGAFRVALDKHKQNNSTPAMLWQHDPSEPIGIWLNVEEDNHGLMAYGKLTLGTRRGAEAYALLKDKAICFSVGIYVANGGSIWRDDIRRIHNIEYLPEISLVSMPANLSAQVVNVKHAAMKKRNYVMWSNESGHLNGINYPQKRR